jgi:hypothetical protein
VQDRPTGVASTPGLPVLSVPLTAAVAVRFALFLISVLPPPVAASFFDLLLPLLLLKPSSQPFSSIIKGVVDWGIAIRRLTRRRTMAPCLGPASLTSIADGSS